jgi:hypothetical protein
MSVSLEMAREWLRIFQRGEFVGEAVAEMRQLFSNATIGEINCAYLVARD